MVYSDSNGMYMKDHVGTKWLTAKRITWLGFDEEEGR